MEFYDEKIKQLAIEIYELDAEVYEKVGSSLGRVFTAERDMYQKYNGGSSLQTKKLACPK